MNRPEKVIYTAKVHTTGGRVGSSRSDDDKLDVRLSRPGTSGAGTNPEQLFAAGWSACYESAMELVARRMKVALPADLAVDAEVDLGPNGAGYDVAVRLNVSLPCIAPDVAQRLIEATHEVCPESRAPLGDSSNMWQRILPCQTSTALSSSAADIFPAAPQHRR